MSESAAPTPIADKALLRLRALAQGNGLDPAKIVLMTSEEKVYELEGITTLTPLFEARTERYDGPPRGKVTQSFADIGALHAAVKQREDGFKNKPDWIAETSAELRKEAAEGWGLNGARIELPKHSVTLAANVICTACRGQKTTPCTQCQGRGYEICATCRGYRQEYCYNCNYNNSGTGSGSAQLAATGQICPICAGRRHFPCRTCRGTGQTACPTCQARGTVPCPVCKGAGQSTEAVHITCGATTSFNFKGEELPSGLRRGLDRLGIVNLAKGHAEITFVENKATEEPEPEEYIPGGLYGVAPGGPRTQAPEENDPGFGAPVAADGAKAPRPLLHYTARMPFADLRIDFAGKKAVVGVFGLRNAFVDVPPFLDDPLNRALDTLIKAVKGHGTIDTAFETRALREALELNLERKGTLKEFRHLYPVGVSNGVAENVLRGTHNSIKRLTLFARMIAAAGSTLLAVGLFGACYFSSLPQKAAQGSSEASLTLDFLPPAVAGMIGLAALNFAAYFDLHRHFPKAPIGRRQSTGKTGYALLVVLVILWLAMLAFSPARPLWLPLPVQ